MYNLHQPKQFSNSTFQRKVSFIVFTFVAVLLTSLVHGGIQTAKAQQDCSASSWSVSNETELNEAIVCFNAKAAAGIYTIELVDDVSLTASPTAIYNATSGVELVIEGSGFAVDGQGNAGVRPFAIWSDTTVTMNDLAVTGGNMSGGGFANKGGGINNQGALALNRTTVSGNTHSDRGGGIANNGTLIINQSTIADNVLPPGSLHAGGGIYTEGNYAQVTINTSTLSGNHHHALYIAGGDATLDSATVTENGDGLYVGSLLTSTPHIINLKNSILDNNGLGVNGDCYFPYQDGNTRVLNDGGHNLVGYGDETCGIVDGQNGNITLQASHLGPLADNGGPTQTHAPHILLSPVLDAGATALTEDQRGEPRPLGPAADMGSYESQRCGGLDTWTVESEDEWNAAIDCFNLQTAPNIYTIRFARSIGLPASSNIINNNTAGVSLVIDGNGHDLEGNDLDEAARLLEIEQDTEVTVQNLHLLLGHGELTGGVPNPGEFGGAILNRGNLTLSRSTIDNSVAEKGGAVYNGSTGEMLIEDSTIEKNGSFFGAPAALYVGAVYNEGVLETRSSTISENKAVLEGGGIFNASGGTLVVSNSTISGNSAGVYGGGIVNAGKATVSNSTISSNTSVANGGGLWNSGVVTVSNSTVSGNTSTSNDGGGLDNAGGGTMTIQNSTVSGNSATEHAGGLFSAGTTNIDSTTFSDNSSSNIGSAIYLLGGTTTIKNSVLANASGGVECAVQFGSVVDGGHNLVEDTHVTCPFVDGVNNNIVGQDPALGPLADNGGSTQTHALLPGSPALDTGDTALATDQRGVSRPQLPADDIGAFELEKGMVSLQKLTNGTSNSNMAWNFTLTGPGVSESVSTPPSLINFNNAYLIAGETYQLCETGIPSGWATHWKGDGGDGGAADTVIPIVAGVNDDPVDSTLGYSRVFDPNFVPPPDEYTNDTRCINFTVEPGQTKEFSIDNSFPGGEPRTIGFWKNWNNCTGGNQAATAAANGGPAAGWFILDDVLNNPGLTIGVLHLDGADCEDAVNVLDKRQITGRNKKMANDAAYNLASQLLAAKLNLSVGAETCQAVVDAVHDGQNLLASISFNGSGGYLRSKDGQPYQDANSLAATLDLYNNGDLCTP